MSVKDLPPLREVVSKYGIRPRRALGQNFIYDLNITDKIARLAGDLSSCDVFEVGPGPGALTRSLLAAGARGVLVVEKDRHFLPALEEIACASGGRLRIRIDDARFFDSSAMLAPPVVIVANLPYNIATFLLGRWLTAECWPPVWRQMVLMFQQDVADRIVAGPGSRTFGRLSVLSQWRTEARIVMRLPAAVFVPPPRVRSAVVSFTPLPPRPDEVKAASLERVVATAFGQRRKTLRRSLAPLAADAGRRIQELGIDPGERAEQLDVGDFRKLARAFEPAGTRG